MFRTISENPNKPAGKFADAKSLNGKATHFVIGEDNEFVGAKSTIQRSFVDHGAVKRRDRCEPPKSEISLGNFPMDYNSNSMHSYHPAPKE